MLMFVFVVAFPFHWWCACTKSSRLELDNNFSTIFLEILGKKILLNLTSERGIPLGCKWKVSKRGGKII